MSLIEKHKAKWANAKITGQRAPAARKAAMQPLDMQFAADVATLKSIQNHDDRDKLKPALLDKYRADLQAFIDNGKTTQNDILFYNMMWAADVGQWDWALSLADYAIETSQAIPEGFKSPPATFITNLAVDQFQAAYEDGDSALFPVLESVLERVDANTWQVNDLAKAYLFKQVGLVKMESDTAAAIDFFNRAYAIYPKVGVKNLLKQLGAENGN